MLTPAEELGLAGHSVAARVRRALRQLDEGLTKDLLSALTTDSWERRCDSERDGKHEAVRLLPTPMTLLADQLQSLHSVSLALHHATRRLLPMSLADEAVHDVVRLSEEEDAWLRELWTPAVAATNRGFGRLDAVVDVTSAHWNQTLQFIEPNMNGVGGLQPLLAAEAFPMLLRAAAHRVPGAGRRWPRAGRVVLLRARAHPNRRRPLGARARIAQAVAEDAVGVCAVGEAEGQPGVPRRVRRPLLQRALFPRLEIEAGGHVEPGVC
jgi:hypothetical protein